MEIGPNGVKTEMVVDTGGTWIVVDPGLAALAGIEPAVDDRVAELMVRGSLWRGRLVRATATFLADQGHNLVVEGSFFVPELDPGDEWRAPSFLGWSGCLEHVRFAVDPQARTFSFAPVDPELRPERTSG
ncbi:MAG: hypothetical protein ABMA64_37395 [Myxococcota bacterium]